MVSPLIMRIPYHSPRYAYQGLFISMVLGLVLTSFLYHHPYVHILANIFFTLVFILAVYSLKDRKLYFVITLGLAVITALTSWIYVSTQNPFLLYFEVGMRALFFGYLVVLFATQVFSHEEVRSETIFGALCVYFLSAFFWAFVFSLIDLIDPQSFDLGNRPEDISSFIYFSLVTLSTLGYGDITPNSPAAQSLASLEAVFGQLYLAVVVARFVGIEIANKRSKKS